jgi:KRAB domain-containing zinc finger protein
MDPQHCREEHGTPRFACQFCGKGFYYRSFMLNHQRLHTGDYKECICDLCGAVYKSVQVLNRHVRNAHQDLRNHKCPHCEKAGLAIKMTQTKKNHPKTHLKNPLKWIFLDFKFFYFL